MHVFRVAPDQFGGGGVSACGIVSGAGDSEAGLWDRYEGLYSYLPTKAETKEPRRTSTIYIASKLIEHNCPS